MSTISWICGIEIPSSYAGLLLGICRRYRLGRPLYERFGLTVMYVDHLDAYEPNASDEWKKMEREILPMHWYFMWKPAEGVYQKGKTVVPWETGSNRR